MQGAPSCKCRTRFRPFSDLCSVPCPNTSQSPCHVKTTCLAYRKFLSETFSASAVNNGGRCCCSYSQMTSQAPVAPKISRASWRRSKPERCCPRASETCISSLAERVHLLRVGAGARKGLALVAEPPVDEPMLAPKVHVPQNNFLLPCWNQNFNSPGVALMFRGLAEMRLEMSDC